MSKREHVKRRERGEKELLPWAAALLPYAVECVNWELSECDPPPCIIVILSLPLNNIVSPVDVGGFAEPRKILCVSVFALR